MGKAEMAIAPTIESRQGDSRTYWTDEQVDLLAKAIIKDCKITSSYEVMPIHYQAVEKILPKEKRRMINGRHAMVRIIKRVAQLLNEDLPPTSPNESKDNRIFWLSNDHRMIARLLVEKLGVKSKEEVAVGHYYQIAEHIPEARRRKITQLRQLAEVIEEIPNQLRALQTEREDKEREDKAKQELEQEIERAKNQFTLTLDMKATKSGAILDLLMETYAIELAERFTSHLHKSLEKITDGQIARSLGIARAGETHKPRVLIVGLLPDQANMMIEEFGSLLDVRCPAKDVVLQSIRDRIKNVDVVIGMTDFMSHSQDGALKEHPHYIRHQGGLTQLRRKLLEIGVGAYKPEAFKHG